MMRGGKKKVGSMFVGFGLGVMMGIVMLYIIGNEGLNILKFIIKVIDGNGELCLEEIDM